MFDFESIKKRYHFAIFAKWSESPPLAVLAVTGEDTWEFLQGQFSQEVRPGRSGPVAHGLWLTTKGRIFGDAVVVRGGDGAARVLSWSLPAAALRARLEGFIIADDVTLDDETSQWRGACVAGGGGVAALTLPTATDGVLAWSDPVPLPGGSGRMVSRGALEPAWFAQVERVDELTWLRLRLAAGVPQVPEDAGEGDLPQEAGLVDTMVSFNKGCYLGQEVMARVKSMGRVRRELRRVAGFGPCPPGSDPVDVWQDGRRIGSVRSRVPGEDGEWFGLAMVTTANLDAGRSVQIGSEGTATEAWIEAVEVKSSAA